MHTYIHTGDGICSSPEEYAGFGRFGCIKDCGRFTNTTKIYINMQDFFDQVKAVDRWDVSKTTPYTTRPNPRFTYNIWSEWVTIHNKIPDIYTWMHVCRWCLSSQSPIFYACIHVCMLFYQLNFCVLVVLTTSSGWLNASCKLVFISMSLYCGPICGVWATLRR
jgi:hypothetical protein